MVRAANERSPRFYLGCTLWGIVSVLLIAWDFGVFAFVGSILLSIWLFGLREKFSNEETASAYSVFNRDGKAIVGGFTAAQFDRQMRGGLGNRADDPVKGEIATAARDSTTNRSREGLSPMLTEDEKLRRRKAAAAAAERRFQQQE